MTKQHTKMASVPDNDTRLRILDSAERLFMSRGYASVKLRDIADAVQMRHASLYYYAPTGKEGLYVEVMTRSFHRHRDGLEQVIKQAGEDFRAQIHAVACWMATSEPIDFSRMVNADMQEISPKSAQLLMDLAFESVRVPLENAITQAKAKGIADVDDPTLAAMSLVGIMQSIHMIPRQHVTSSQMLSIAIATAEMLLKGWLKR